MLIEYAKESLGVKHEGKQIGFFRDIGCTLLIEIRLSYEPLVSCC